MNRIIFEKSWQKSAMADAASTVLNHDANPEMQDMAVRLYGNFGSYLRDGIPKKDLKLCIAVLYSAMNLFKFQDDDFNEKRVKNYGKTVKFLLDQTA